MAHYGTLREYSFRDGDTGDASNDIRGAIVYDPDDKEIGKIDDVIFNHSSGDIHYVVVDAGGWLSSKKFIVPPQQLHPSSEHKDDFVINITKSQVEKLPAYDDSAAESEEGWRDYESRYQESWVSGAIQHRDGSDHERVLPAGGNEVPSQKSAAGIGGRWSTFEDQLRSWRREITTECETCRAESASGTASERERGELRKAG